MDDLLISHHRSNYRYGPSTFHVSFEAIGERYIYSIMWFQFSMELMGSSFSLILVQQNNIKSHLCVICILIPRCYFDILQYIFLYMTITHYILWSKLAIAMLESKGYTLFINRVANKYFCLTPFVKDYKKTGDRAYNKYCRM